MGAKKTTKTKKARRKALEAAAGEAGALVKKFSPPDPADSFLSLLEYTGTTHSQLARALGVSPGTLGDWMSGRRHPRPDQWRAARNLIILIHGDLAPDARRDHVIEIGNHRAAATRGA